MNKNELIRKYESALTPLGSKQVDVMEFGGKAANLNILTNNGIPVPEGYAVSRKYFDEYITNGEISSLLVSAVAASLDQFGEIAIRSSATCEDGRELSMAGVFETYYVTKKSEIRPAIEAIYSQALSEDAVNYVIQNHIDLENYSMALVIQKLITPDISGVAYSNTSGDLLIQYVNGFGNKLVDGVTSGSQILIDSKSSKIKSSVGFDEIPVKGQTVKNLNTICTKIQNIFKQKSQDIEFVVQGDRIMVVQARPLTRELEFGTLAETLSESLDRTIKQLETLSTIEKGELGIETSAFSNSNFIELLPNPAEMDYGVFSYIFTGINNQPGAIQLGRREMGYPLGNESIGFMHYVAGKPYMSIARDAGTFYAGFPDSSSEYFTSLVNSYLKAVDANPQKAIYPEMGLYLQDPTLDQLEAIYGQKKGGEYFQKYLLFKERMAKHSEEFENDYRNNLEEALFDFILNQNSTDLKTLSINGLLKNNHEILEHLRNESCVYFVKAARLGFYYSQKLQTDLQKYLKLSESRAEEIFSILTQGLEGSAITQANIDIFNANDEKEAIIIAKKVVGHYSTGEMLEIRHPRLKDSSNDLLKYVRGIRNNPHYKQDFERQASLRITETENVLGNCPESFKHDLSNTIAMAQKYMSLRETVKYAFVYEYSLLRDRYLEIAHRTKTPENEIFFLYPTEIEGFVKSTENYRHLIKSRQNAFNNYQKIKLPPVIREKDIKNLSIDGENKGEFTELIGKFLSDGPTLRGVVVNLDAMSVSDAENIIMEIRKLNLGVILVAKQMNLSHDPLIAIADSIVLENAGIVSHGAQRARELGRSALGGIPTSQLKSGIMVEINPRERKVTKISSNF